MNKEDWTLLMSAIQDVAQEGACPLCGANVNSPMADIEDNQPMTTCPGCGSVVPANSDFCPKCGTELDVSEPGEL